MGLDMQAWLDFNSHTREGVTLLVTQLVNCINISTHTPVRV